MTTPRVENGCHQNYYSIRNKGLIRPYYGKPMVNDFNDPLMRPYFWWGVARGGHDFGV